MSGPRDAFEAIRVPPHSVEAEQSVLGGLLLDNLAWERIADLLTANDFYRRDHQLIYAAIVRQLTRSEPADVITVYQHLKSAGTADEAGGLNYINAIAQSVPSAANTRRYAEIVREQAILRAVASIGADLTTSAMNAQGRSAQDILNAAAIVIGDVERRQQRKAPRVVGDLLANAIDRYTELAEGRRALALATGISPLDSLLAGGLRAGKTYGIAARPGVGKSSAARTMLLHLAKAGVRTLLLSQEMPVEEIADALVAESGRIDSTTLQTGKFDENDWGRIVEAIETLRRLPLHIDDEGGLTIAQVRAKARSVKGLQVLALDYLQLSTSTLKGKSTNDEIAEISRGLKALALELGIPILVLSQLNREADGCEPQLRHLRDSGAIEQDLDVAVLLWSAQEGDESRLVGWKVAKHRGGKKGMFGMRWMPAINEWHESAESIRQMGSATKRDRGFE